MSIQQKILTIPLRISIAILLLGMLAKILEQGFAKEIMLLGFAAIGLLYIFRFLKKEEKRFIDYTKLILVIFWTSNGIFRIMNFPYTLFFQAIIAISFVIWFVMEGTAYFMDSDRKAKNTLAHILWNCSLIAGTLGVIFGSLLNIIHWEYSIHLLSLGITLVAAYILKDVFITSETDEDEEFQV